MTLKMLATIATALIATAAVAEEKMTVSTTSSACVSQATNQLNLAMAKCAVYPVYIDKYGACVTSANLTYANAVSNCPVAPGGPSGHLVKLKGLRGSDIKGATSPVVSIR